MWVIDDTGFAKKGRFSVGVGRQYSGTLGRVDNCQVGVSVNAATDRASCPLSWRIFLPAAWDDDHERRAKAHVPDGGLSDEVCVVVVMRPRCQGAVPA
jgi:SRSO17 transposase